MTLAVILLWANAVVFAGFGLGFTVAPQELAEFFTGGAPVVPSAVIDMRATYGGMSLGLGAFFALCAARQQWVRPGLWAALLAVAGLGLSRVVGLVADGEPNAFMFVFLATEVVGVALMGAALRMDGSQPGRLIARPGAASAPGARYESSTR